MKLTDFRQTVFVTDENLNKVTFEFDEFEEGAKIEILGKKFAADGKKISVLIPCVNEETLAPVTLHLADGSFVSYTYTVKPVYKSEVLLVNISDGNAPFNDYCTLGRSTADYRKASAICKEIPDFRYAAEIPGIPQDDLVPDSQIEILPDFSVLCTAAASGEDIAEKLGEIKKYGTVCETVFIGRASGLSMGAIPYLADAGIKYAIIDKRNFRNSEGYFAAELFRLSCKNSEITVYINTPTDSIIPEYEKSLLPLTVSSELVEYKLFLKSKNVISEFEDKTDRLLGSKKVIPIIRNGHPEIFIKALCDEMNSKWKYPVFSMETPTGFMKKLSDNTEGGIPYVSGEISCPTADDMTGLGYLAAKKRKLSHYFPSAAAFALIKAMENGENRYNEYEFEKVSAKLADFYCGRIDFTDKNPIEMHKFNMFYSKAVPLTDAENITNSSFEKFIDRNAEGFITVINTTLGNRTTHLISPVPLDKTVCQKTGEGYLTEPLSLPSFGAKSFICGEYREGTPFAVQTANTADTGVYRISFDPKTGQIKSITENITMRELLDPSSGFFLGDMIYTAGSGDDIEFNRQKCIDFKIENGPLAFIITRHGIEEQSRAEVSCTVTFYRNSKNIDIKLKFTNAAALSGDFYDRYRKNIFFAFPFKCEDYRFKSTHITGEICESKDRLPFGSGDFAVCQRYAAVENDYCGTAVFCREMPVFHFGVIQYGRFSPQPSCTSAHMYLYAASNRANQLVYDSAEDACGEFNLSIYPYRGKQTAEISAAAENFLYPPLCVKGYSVERSRINVSDDGIGFGCLKPCNDGSFILRIYETLGIQRRLTITLPFNIKQAYRSDILCRTKDEITEFYENKITADIDASSPLTLKLFPSRNYTITKEDNTALKSYSYTAHCGRCVAVWDKNKSNPKNKYEIFCDGEKIAEAKNQNSETQIYMTEIFGKHNIEIK